MANTKITIPVRPFRAEDIQELLAQSGWPCVSIHLPTHRRFPESRQDPIKFKTLLAQAEAAIEARDAGRGAGSLLDPLRRLSEDEGMWEHSLDGIAVFWSPSFAAAYRVPMPIPEEVVVSETFHTKPLFRFLRTNSRYYVVSVTQNSVGLYQGTSYGAEPVNLKGLPGDLTAALGVSELDEDERGFSAHGAVPAGRVYHGRGPGKEDRKEVLVKFFRAIDKGLHDYLREERAPLLLAAVRYYHPIYREANTYPHLLEEGLDGNYERSNGDVIHAEAWPIVSRDVERRIAEWMERYRSLSGKGLAVDGVQAVASATVQGRVLCVLASEDGDTWGRLDRATGQVHVDEASTGREDADLLDDICEEAWKRGAEIYVLPRASLPTQKPIAAVLRF
jgi:hypothetical protein